MTTLDYAWLDREANLAVSPKYCVIIGHNADATADSCVVIGHNVTADEEGMVAIGPLRIHADGRIDCPGDVPTSAIVDAVREAADLLRGPLLPNTAPATAAAPVPPEADDRSVDEQISELSRIAFSRGMYGAMNWMRRSLRNTPDERAPGVATSNVVRTARQEVADQPFLGEQPASGRDAL